MMKKQSLLDLDVDQLFETHNFEDILDIQKQIDAEIENKRLELRSMVAARYRDVLSASDSIKWMKSTSEQIVLDVKSVKEQYCSLLEEASAINAAVVPHKSFDLKNEDRILAMQTRLVILLNEHIFSALDGRMVSRAAQIYLLAQYVHTGIRLLRKNVLDEMPILLQLKETLEKLKSLILEQVDIRLRSIQMNVHDCCDHLSAVTLLQHQNLNELLRRFLNYRKIALELVFADTNESVRKKITDIIKIVATTLQIVYSCFLDNNEYCLMLREINAITSDNAPITLSYITLPNSPLNVYIPEIIKKFRPRNMKMNDFNMQDSLSCIAAWFSEVNEIIRTGIINCMKLVNNVKGLCVIRDEAVQIEMPSHWDTICLVAGVPSLTNIWAALFQSLIAQRVKELIDNKIYDITNVVFREIKISLQSLARNEEDRIFQWTWEDLRNDVGREEDYRKCLSMKTKGFHPKVVTICDNFDASYLELLKDISVYLYGSEFDTATFTKHSKTLKCSDQTQVESYLKQRCKVECARLSNDIISILENDKQGDIHISKSLLCARTLYAFTELCPNLKICANCDSSNSTDWTQIKRNFTDTSHLIWDIVIQDSCRETAKNCSKIFLDFSAHEIINILARWDLIDIQEQTEDQVFKSQIKVPMKPSFGLNDVLNRLSDYINRILPHTLPKIVHQKLVATNVKVIFEYYGSLQQGQMNQTVALQFLFDVKYLTTLSVAREDIELLQASQEICDNLRGSIDPFDLDVFYKYLQENVRQSALQTQVIFGTLLPSPAQLAHLGTLNKQKELDRLPSVLPVSIPAVTAWFPLLPVTAPISKANKQTRNSTTNKTNDMSKSLALSTLASTTKKAAEAGASVRSGAAALFGAMTTDWFSN